MERIQALIDKLYQLRQQGAGAPQLLATVQLLQSELVKMQQKGQALGTSRVAVTMPVNFNISQEDIRSNREFYDLPSKDLAEIPSEEITTSLASLAHLEVHQQERITESPYALKKPVIEEKQSSRQEPRPVTQAQSSFFSAWEDANDEAPTLIQHQAKEVNELISNVHESLNDRLKEEKTELASRLKEAPIKDLRKGIGINDRFTFVSELFRGDEAMYERSIKTINSFNIYSEAEYWMTRELRLKLGWNEDRETVKHFYQLVRRRFS
jgi:hypothetical protein